MKHKKKISRRDFIKNSVKGTAVLAAGGYNILISGCSKAEECDLLISGGTLFDGTGASGREIDIAVKGDKIFRLGKNLPRKKAKKVIEAKGLAVSPGFIDAHDHTDLGLLSNPRAESQVRQGVTTVISGNCGDSPFPIPDLSREEARHIALTKYGVELDWEDMNGFFKRLEKRGMALNYGTLLGHGSLRGKVVGLDDRPPTEAQLADMKKMAADIMKAGALGISSGLEYAPGSYAKTPELIELCRTVARHNGVYATHMRHEGEFLLEALDEAIQIAREAGISLQISHLKVANESNWHKIDAALAKIEAAKKEGIRILADRYPYTAGSTGLSYYFPLWAKQGPTKDFIARLKDPALDGKLRAHAAEKEKKLGSWEKVLISSVFTAKNKKFEGQNILECAEETKKEPYEFMRDLLIQEENRVSMITFFAKEENLRRILAHPLVVIGSDGSAVAPYGMLGKGKPHPRLYGTFPRVLGRYVRQEKILNLEQAIQKMTSRTAQKFGLTGRGLVKEGYFADLVVFDPDKIIDRATWKASHQYSLGISRVIVNGTVVIREGEHSDSLPGRILTKARGAGAL